MDNSVFLSNWKNEYFYSRMKKGNALILLGLKETEGRLFRFKSALSKEILLHVSISGEECEMRHLMKVVNVTPVAARQHIQLLEHEGFLVVSGHKSNGRCKMVSLTEKSRSLLKEYEVALSETIQNWEPCAGT